MAMDTSDDLEALVASAVEKALARRAAEEAAAQQAEQEAQLGASLANLAVAIDAAIELERFTFATRTIKVALFDGGGRFCGHAENRADLIDQQEADTFTRLIWRAEWDDLMPEPVVLPSGRVTDTLRLPVPDLADVPGGPEEAQSQRFSDYPVPDFD